MNRTREQKRAHNALQFIKIDAARLTSSNKQKLHTHIRKAPVQVLQNGLGQMLAFLAADNGGKRNGEHKDERKPSGIFYDYLKDWLCGAMDTDHPCRVYPETETGLLEQLVAGDRNQYIQAQRETLALFNWLKKFADAWLSEGEG